MLPATDLAAIAWARLKDAQLLLQHRRFDGAAYLSGYAVEIAIKARIVKTLKWRGFPESAREFASLQSFKSHDLEALLYLSGWYDKVKLRFPTEWLAIEGWRPESRYRPPGLTTEAEARRMIESAKAISGALL